MNSADAYGQTPFRVAIIGAGFSGIAAAIALLLGILLVAAFAARLSW